MTRNLWQNSGAANDLVFVENGKIIEMGKEEENKKQFGLKDAVKAATKNSGTTKSGGAAAPSSSSVQKAAEDAAAQIRSKNGFDLKKASASGKASGAEERAKNVSIKDAISEEGIKKAKAHEKKVAEEKKRQLQLRAASLRASIPVDTQTKTAQENAAAVRGWMDERRAKRAQEEKAAQLKTQAKKEIPANATFYDVVGVVNKYANDKDMLNAIQSVLGDELEENRKLYHKYGDENVYFNEAEEDILNGNIPSKYAHLYDYDAFKTAYNNHQKSVLKYDYVSDILQGNFYAKSPVSENGIDLDYAREQAAESAEAGKLLAKSTKPRTDTAYEDYVKKNGGSFKNALYAEAEGAEDIAKEIEKASDFYEKHADNTYNDNLFGRIAANYRQGDIGVRSGDAGYVSMKHKDENLVANDIYDFLADRLYSNNIKTFTNNTGFDEFVANNAAYAPQFLRQLSANVKGQIEGGFAGAVVGYGVAGPAGVATGALEGRKYGAAYESAKFMYKQTAGGAYVKALRETGNVELAYEMAKDEALASAAIEYAMELAVNSVFGAAGLLKKPFNNVLEEAGKKISTALVKKGISKGAQKSFGKVVRVVADGLVNMITEPTEEYLQEGVSIRAEQALAAGEDTNPGKLILRAMQSDSYTADDIARMNDAKDAAIMLAFLGGSVKLAGTGRDVYVDTKTQKAVDTVQAFDYMTGNARMEFDNLTPGAQKIVKQEFSDRPQELQNFIKQQSPTASISKEAQAAVDDMLSPLKKKTTQSMQGKIVPNMDDNVRSKVLKQKKITTVVAKNNYKLNLTDADIASLQTKYKSAAKPILKRIAEQFGLLGKRMDNKDIQVEFIYSTGSLNESIHRQHKEYETFAKMLTVFDDVVKNAVGVEVHKDKYFGTQRATPDLKNVYVLASAFFDGNEIVPVQLEVKEFRNQDNKLYLSVCLKNKTEAGRLAEDADNVGLTSAAPTASTISISEILENVNPEYGDFLKYFPDSMLSKEQIEAKNAALAKEAEYLESIRKDNSSSKSDTTPAGVEDFDVQKKGVNPELQKQLDDHIIVQSDGDVQKVNPELQKSIADHEAVFEKKKAETENELFSGTDREIETKVNELLAPGNAAACAKLLLDDNIQHVKGGYLDTNAPRFREVFFTQYRNVIEKLLTAANTVVLPTNSDLKKSFVDFAKRYIQANCKASPEMRADYFKEIADILNYQDPDGFTKENYPYYERVYYENLPDLLSTIDTYVQTVAAARMVDMGIISPKTRSNQNIYFAVPEGKRKFELQHPEGNVTQQEDKKEDAPQIAPEEISKLDVSDEVKRAIESPHIKVDISEAFAEKAKKLDIRQRGKLAQLPRNLLAKFFKVKLMDEPPSMLTRDIRKRCEIAAAGDPELEEFLYDGFLKYVDEGQKIGTSREMRDAQAVYKFMNEIGIKPDSKEDAAAQMLGEGYWQDQYGERHTYTLQDVKREFPKTWGKIVQLKDFVRSVYDRLGNEGNRDLKIIYPDAISYYEAEMEKKWTRIEELRDKPGYVQSRIRVFENEIAKLQRDIDNLQKRKESKSDVRQSLDAIEGKKEAAVQSFEARKRKDTKAAAADEAKVARYEDKARSVQRTNDAYIDNQIEALERKKTRLEADIRKQKQKISDASLANDAKQISRLELEIRDIENGLDTGELIRDRRILIRDNYFHHRKAEKRSTSAKFIALLEKKVSIDPELVGTSRETKPKRRFEGIMQHQGTDDYTPGALAGLLEYIPQVHRMTSSDYVLAHGREFVKSLAFATKETKNANGLIEHMTEYLNIMAGKTSFLDRAPQMLKGRKFLRFMDIAAGLRKKALFPFSFTIAMKQFSNISNLPYHVKNPASVVKGLWDMKDLFKKDSKKSRIIAQSGFLNERYIDKFYRKLDNKISAERVSSFMLEAGDQLAANIIWFSAYEDAVRKKDKLVLKNQAPGKYADPILYADNITRQCVGGRGQGELPPILESKTVKAMFPFVVESMNSQHNFDDAVRKGDVLGVLFSQLIMASINAGLGALGLGAVGFDFVEAAADIFDIFFGEEEDGDDEEEEETLTDKSIQAAQRLGAELIESRWYAPILSLFAGTDAWQSLLGDAYDDNVLSNELLAFSPIADAMRKNDIREIFYGYVPGGAQIKRTKSFLQDMGYIPEIKHNFDDWFSYVPRQKISASYTDKGELRFPIKSTLGNHIKGVLFGEYATNEGMTYIDEERKPLSEERTALFNDMVKDGLDAQYIYDAINTVAGINKGKNQAARQRRAIMDMDLTPAQKLQLDTGILGENKNPVDYTSEDTFFETAYEKKQQNTFRLMALGLDAVTAEAYVNTVSKIEGEKDETGNPTDYSKREKRVDWINADKYLNNAQKAFLYRNYVINDDKTYKPYYVARALGTFSDDELAEFFPQFMKVEPDFYANGKTVPKSKNKNVRALANKLGLSQEQKDVYYYYFYTNSKEGDNAEAKILNKLYKKLTPEQKKDFVAWYEDNDKRVDEKALLKVLEGLN